MRMSERMNSFNFLKKIDVAGKFAFGLIVSMVFTFVITGFIILNQQSNAFESLLNSSKQTTYAVFEKSSKDAKNVLITKVKSLASLLASISPNAIAESEISTLNIYAKEVNDDPDIRYVAFYDVDGTLLNIVGDKSALKKDLYVTKKIVSDDLDLGKVVIGYTFDLLNKKLQVAKAENMENIANMIKARDAALQASIISITVALTISGIIIVLVLLWMFRAMVANRLTLLKDNMKGIAEEDGDLTCRIPVKGDDCIDKVGYYLNLFLDKIHSTISQVNNATTQIGSSAAQLSGITEETTIAINAQQSETEQVATAINEMAATVAEVSRSATEAASAAQEADVQSNDGQQVVNDSIEYIGKLASDVEEAAEVIENLKDDSESISGVLDVIQGIAEQTNLLALNAAIEAARAGEQGRGFAVVADEVRTLAQRTQESTTEIKEMIDKLQTGAENAVNVMSQGREQAQKSVDKANETGNSLEAITAAVATINLMNTQIASATEEQNSVAEEVNKNINKISEHGEKTANGANQSALASSELTALSAELSSLMKQFKI